MLLERRVGFQKCRLLSEQTCESGGYQGVRG